jgi:ATP-dependent Clp protease ATP-binding subunit ClpA
VRAWILGAFERFTVQARRVVVLVREEARALKHHYVGTERLLLGLLREQQGTRPAFWRRMTSPSRAADEEKNPRRSPVRCLSTSCVHQGN